MGVVLKCLLGVLAIFCFMQFVKMDDDTDTTPEPQFDLEQAIKDAFSKLPSASPADVGKMAEKFTETLQSVFKDGSKQLSEVAGKLQAMAKENLGQSE